MVVSKDINARLVAKGYNQLEGIDFDETFSPVIKPTTIRTVLTFAIVHQWQIRQLDVKNAFFLGHLKRNNLYVTTSWVYQPQLS